MVTFAQARERAEEWVNGQVPRYQHREARVREFGLGFVLWAEDRQGGPRSDGGGQRLVIARDSGETTLWPALAVDEVIRRYTQEYARVNTAHGPTPVPTVRGDLHQTSFLLSPPGWPQEAADRLGTPDGRLTEAPGSPAGPAGPGTTGSGAVAAGAVVPDASALSGSSVAWPVAGGSDSPAGSGADIGSGATPWSGTDTNASTDEDGSVPLPVTVFGTPLNQPEDDTTELLSADDRLLPTTLMPTVSQATDAHTQPDAGTGAGAAGTSRSSVPPPPPSFGGPGGSAGVVGGRGAVHDAETVSAGPPGGGPAMPRPSAPPLPPLPPPVLAPPGALRPPVPPGMSGGAPPGMPGPGQPPVYGGPRPTGRPTVGPGYQAVLRYRARDGSEQQLIRRSAPGTPHPEWQIFYELRAMGVPPDQVLELHTELESCELPGAYCARMIREQWPQARITNIAPYGTDYVGRRQGMRQLLIHQSELCQVANGPARMAPVRAPLVPAQPAPPLPPEAVGHELAGAFGPGVFRFEQQAVSREGMPPVVAHTLVAAGLPLEIGPFFWAGAQPGCPVPTLAELAAEQGARPASDAGSYLVMGSDFGKAICVRYGTAEIVAVPVEAGPGGVPVAPQFVNTGLPEFVRCLALLGRMWRLRFGLNQEQAGHWTVDFQTQLAALDPAALGSPESWWSVLLEQMWDGLL